MDDGTVPGRELSYDYAKSKESCYERCAAFGSISYELQCNGTTLEQGNIQQLDSVNTSRVDEKKIPNLNVEIPGLTEEELEASVTTDEQGNIETNLIGVYVNAVFMYGIVVATIVAVVILMIAGFQYMTAGGNKKGVTQAKERIRNTVIGLILLLSCYSIAFLIDPRTTRFSPLSLQNIDAIEYFPPEGEDLDLTPNDSLTGATEAMSGNYLNAPSAYMRYPAGARLDGETLEALREAAKDFYTTYKKRIVITSATRDLEKQARLFYNNCLKTGGVCSIPTCNPASSSVILKQDGLYKLTGTLRGVTNGTTIITEMVANAKYGNCPHTSAVAIDAWCDDGGSNYQHNPTCQANLITTMIKHGFCRLKSEVWHFELNTKKVSTNCSASNSSIIYSTANSGNVAPPANCQKWDFKKHTCIVKVVE